ncbi:hypothetical protein [Sporosarcina contaminans]
MERKCQHKWVIMEDGSLDKFCVRCRRYAKQAQLAMPATVSASVSASQPILRETIEVPFYNGSEHTRMTVYKDDLIKQINKEIGLTIDHFNNSFKSGL